MTRSTLKVLSLTAVVMLVSAAALADSTEVLTFSGLGDNQPVGNFYNGSGLTSTPNYGVTFSSNFYGLTSFYNGGAGAFSPTPTTTPAIFMGGVTTGTTVMGVMNVTAGFSGGLNFYFTAGFAPGQSESVQIWSGANGTGTILATINLSNNNSSCNGYPTYCLWSSAGASFTGTAKSVTFSGPANELGIADITVGSNSTAIPEPSSAYLLGAGVAALSLTQVRRLFGLQKRA
jgi:hypothetical protein